MRSSRVLERPTANAEVAIVLGSIPHSSIFRHTVVEPEGRQKKLSDVLALL